MKTILFSIIIFILFYIIYILHTNNCDNTIIIENNNNLNYNIIKSYLEGYWISDNNFLKLSDIENLILYIDIINNFGYLIIIKDKKIIHNIDFQIILDYDSINFENNNLNNVVFDIIFNSNDINFIWNDILFKCILSIDNGNLKLFNDNTLYANVFKDNKISYYLKD